MGTLKRPLVEFKCGECERTVAVEQGILSPGGWSLMAGPPGSGNEPCYACDVCMQKAREDAEDLADLKEAMADPENTEPVSIQTVTEELEEQADALTPEQALQVTLLTLCKQHNQMGQQLEFMAKVINTITTGEAPDAELPTTGNLIMVHELKPTKAYAGCDVHKCHTKAHVGAFVNGKCLKKFCRKHQKRATKVSISA